MKSSRVILGTGASLLYEECEFARTGVYDYRYGAPDAWGVEFVARWDNN